MSATALTPLLEEIMQAADRLPPFPQVVTKVMPLIRSMASVSEIEAVIRLDPIIASRVLAMSQSTLFSRRTRIESLKEAIVSLGTRQLVTVILTACASKYFTAHALGYDLQEGELWEHAVGTAILADRVAQEIDSPSRYVAYTGGLLHDIGKTILSFYVEDYLDGIYYLVHEEKLSFLDAERRVLGIDHQQLGALIAHRWNFPPPVITAIGCHHTPQKAREHGQVAAIVYAANRMVSAVGVGCGVDGFLQPNGDRVFLDLNLTSAMIERFMADVVMALDETQQFLSN